MLCTFSPSGPDCLEAGQSPPNNQDRLEVMWHWHLCLLTTSYVRLVVKVKFETEPWSSG